MRAAAPLPDDPVLHACAATYSSDLMLLSTALLPHRLLFGDPRLQMASLDHAVWFHAPFRADDWLCYEQEGPWAGGARALCQGRLFDRAGVLVATVMQEGLIRVRERRLRWAHEHGAPAPVRPSPRPVRADARVHAGEGHARRGGLPRVPVARSVRRTTRCRRWSRS